MACLLDDIVKTQAIDAQTRRKRKNTHSTYSYFASALKPKLSVEEYVHRLATYLHISDSCFILALIYIDRLTERNPEVVIDSYSIHRLCAISVILAMKFNDDQLLFKNKYIANVVGIDVNELCELEYKFMELIEFELFVQPEMFTQYCQHLLSCQQSLGYAPAFTENRIPHVLRKYFKTFGVCSCHMAIHYESSRKIAGTEEASKPKRKVKRGWGKSSTKSKYLVPLGQLQFVVA